MPTLAHLHLLLNHWPIIGTFIAIALLIVSLRSRSEDLEQVTLALFALLALTSIPTYMTGHLVQLMLDFKKVDVSRTAIEQHQGSALLSLAGLQALGALGWLGLWQARRYSHASRWTMWALLTVSVAMIGLVTVTGVTGGVIRHPEIMEVHETASAIGGLGLRLANASQYFVTGASRWSWPVLETLHFIGLALIFGVTGALNLRMLGFMKEMPSEPLHRFLPFAAIGLGINIVTGMMFFVGMPFFYVFNADFHLKMIALVAAGATLVLWATKAFRTCEHLQAGEDASFAAKVLAGSSLILWIAVIVLGRYMPMFEDTLDPHF